MSTAFWSEEEISIVLAAMEEDESLRYLDVSTRLADEGYERSPEAIRKFYRRHQNRVDIPEDNPLAALMSTSAEEAAHQACAQDLYGRIEDIKAHVESASAKKFGSLGLPEKADTKVLCMSDFHFPFQNTSVIEHAIKNHGDADVLVLNGDIMENYIVSKWPKKRVILLEWEYKLAAEFIREMASKFKFVALTLGNHEYRLNSYFAANVDPAVNFLVCNDILSRLADGWDFDEHGEFKKLYTLDNVYYKGGLGSWYVKVGKTIFAHPRFFSRTPMRTAITALEYFKDREDVECLVMSHTHKLGSYILHDKLIMEQGCCCVPLDYEAEGKSAPSLQSFGYAVVYMNKEGHVDFDRSRAIYRGTGAPVKAEDLLPIVFG